MQTWDPDAYRSHGAFVPQLGGAVLEWLDPRPGELILDLGCGDGQLTSQIAARGARVLGLDRSPAMAAAAQARGIAVTIGRADSLPFAPAAFDAVFSNAALHWVRGQHAMLAEVRRVLRPAGRFVAEMGGHGNIAAIQVALAAVLDRRGFAHLATGAYFFPTPPEYQRMLESHGLAVERIELIPRPTPLEAGGMAGWLRTFGREVLDVLPPDLRDPVVDETVALLAPVLRDRDGNWTADYIRLRFISPGTLIPFRARR